MSVSDLRDRICGMIISSALGDTWGSPYEFRGKKYIKDKIEPCILRSRFQGTKTAVLGQITDDSEASMIVMKKILDWKNSIKKKKIIVKGTSRYINEFSNPIPYMDWVNSKIPFLGKNTRLIFKTSAKTEKGKLNSYFNNIDKYFATEKDRESKQSNGALMRSYSFAILLLLNVINKKDDLVKDIFSMWWNKCVSPDIKLSNPSKIALQTEKIYLSILTSILCETKKEDILKPFENFLSIDARDIIKEKATKGWCVTSLYVALKIFKESKSISEGIENAVIMGGDTDTNACIAGALLGAYYGYNSLLNEKHKRKDVLLSNLLTYDTSKGDIPRPKEFEFRNFVNINARVNKVNFFNARAPEETLSFKEVSVKKKIRGEEQLYC